jgi:hypothetical protein
VSARKPYVCAPFGFLALFGVFLLASGCAPLPGSPVYIADQEVAVQMIWEGVLGRGDAAPEVRWVEAGEQNGTDPHSGRAGFETFVGCVEGLTLSGDAVSVSWSEGDTFSVTVLAHELVHAAQARRFVFDPKHHTAAFRPGGAVDQANAALSDVGL